MKSLRAFLFVILLSSLAAAPARAQTPTPSPAAAAVLNAMTPEERVGQLFLVTFKGTDTGDASEVYKLITQYHVGGVVLLAENDNFAAAPETVRQAHALINAIQQIEWDASRNSVSGEAGEIGTNFVYAPLFIGIAQEGNGYPTDQILSGLSPLPSQMAVGATWDTELARRVGETRGRELAALGVNLYFGPSLDVLDTPSASGGDLGTRVFGGDPFWVGEMGRAYIAGLHRGSGGQLRVIAKHFPGVGGSDRLPEEEVSTVRKSLEQLKQIELAPFFAVTGNAPSPEAAADGLLVSHIRYQGFQGNIRATTRPISFDTQALNQILSLSQFSGWQSAGGLIISDNLGTRAVSEFYATGGVQFSARIAARDAFLAGNDMLYLGNLISKDLPDTYTATARVIEFFAQKYKEDPAFAQRVDAAAARILASKLGLYGNLTISNVLTPESLLEEIGLTTDVAFNVARSAATLISPDKQELAALMPLPPQANEGMVFITDTAGYRQCSSCPETPGLAVDALQQTILQLYGPQSGNQTANFRLSSHSLQALQMLLDAQDVPYIEEDIKSAKWAVISLTGSSQGQPALISRFLRERPDLLRGKNIVLFSFGAPYYFDTTTISKISAYYALYSKQPQFVDVAARILFQELSPNGASPVSIPAVGYDLISVMSPNPTQVIPLFLDIASPPESTNPLATPEPTPIPLFRIGDTIAVRTGVILDHNSHPVPDGTVVQFSVLLTGESGGILKQVDAVTAQGVARAAFGLDKPGLLEIKVTSEPAVVSEVLQLDVSQSGAVAITLVVPETTPSVEPTQQAFEAPKENEWGSPQGYPRLLTWGLSMLFIAFGAVSGYGAGGRFAGARAAARWALGIALGGLAAYNLLALGFSGVPQRIASSGFPGLIAFLLAGELLGFTAGWVWSKL
jgi:beta-N-acetylhexosaminidase